MLGHVQTTPPPPLFFLLLLITLYCVTQFHSTPLLILLLANSVSKTAEDGSSGWAPATQIET